MKKINLKKLKFGANSTIIIVFSLVIVVLINILAGLGETRFPAMKIDLTGSAITKITEKTQEVIDLLETDIEIICLKGTSEIKGDVRDVLQQYDARSEKISLKFENYHKNPLLLSKFAISANENCENAVIVVNSKTGRYNVIYYSDMWVRNDNYGIEMDFVLESKLTNAINYVTSEKTVTVSVIKGHNEADTAVLSAVLTAANISVIETDLTISRIPENADIVMILAPQYDYSQSQLDYIDEYLNSGGSVVVSLRADIKLERLEKYLSEWGIEVAEDVLAEASAADSYQGLGTYFYPQMGDHAVVQPIQSRIFASLSRSLNYKKTGDIEAIPLLSTSESGISMPVKNGSFDKENAKVGKYNIAYLLEKPLNGNLEETSKLIVTSSSALWGVIGGYISEYDTLAYSALVEPSFGNAQFVTNSINYLSGQENAFINIPKKSSNLSVMSLDARQSSIYAAVFCIAIPLILIIIGVAVWLKRRNK